MKIDIWHLFRIVKSSMYNFSNVNCLFCIQIKTFYHVRKSGKSLNLLTLCIGIMYAD